MFSKTLTPTRPLSLAQLVHSVWALSVLGSFILLSGCQEQEPTALVFEPTSDQQYQVKADGYQMELSETAMKVHLEQSITEPVSFQFEGASVVKPRLENKEILYEELYPATNLRLYDKGEQQVGYDIILHSGGNVNAICLQIESEEAPIIQDGALLVPTADGIIRHSQPYTYQEIEGERVVVESAFKLEGDCLAFEVGAYDERHTLVIDPMVSFIPNSALMPTMMATSSTTLTPGVANSVTFQVDVLSPFMFLDGIMLQAPGITTISCPTSSSSAFASCTDANTNRITIEFDNTNHIPQNSSWTFTVDITPPIGFTGMNNLNYVLTDGPDINNPFRSQSGQIPVTVGTGGGGSMTTTEYILGSGAATNGAVIDVCEGTFYDTGGPNGDYSDNENFSITFCSENGGDLIMDVISLVTEPQGGGPILGPVCFDEMSIYDGMNTSGIAINSGFCGSANPTQITATSGCFHFVWSSDVSNVESGWELQFSTTANCNAAPGEADYVLDSNIDGQTIMDCTAAVFSDSGDTNGNYGDNEDYTVTFCSDNNEQITLAFENFNTEAGSDLLYIHDGSSTGATQITGSPFSGVGPANSPGTVSSTGECLTIRFTSNSSVNSVGWRANLSCSGDATAGSGGPTWTGYPSSDNCGNATELGGTVYEDIDNNGSQSGNEPGIRDVEVTVFDDNGQVGSPVMTDANGDYTFTGLTASTVYRIEFTVPDLFEESAFGSGSGTAVQFAETNTCDNDLGLLDVGHYCGTSNPLLIIPCYNNGSSSHTSNSNETAIAAFDYTESGNSQAASYQNYVTIGAVGSVWGTAYQRSNSTLYMGAFLKRHTGLGPGGIGAIYTHEDGDPSSTVSTFYDFGAAAGSVAGSGARFPGGGGGFGQLGACGRCDNVDPTTFSQVGKAGFGDIELSDDEQTLYVVNLFDRKVYGISTNNPAPGSATPLVGMPWLSNAACNNGTARPWAMKYRRGKLYVGVVCDGGSGGCNPGAACNDLTASIYSFDGSSWTTELTFPLTYFRTTYRNGSNYWVRWIDNWSQMAPYVDGVTDAQFAQPILADIEFDDDGSMIIGLGDRTTMQLGYQAPRPTGPSGNTSERTFAHGDVLRAYYNPNNQTFAIENNGSAGPLNSANPYSNTGPGGKSFYWGDFWYGYQFSPDFANGSGVGPLALLPGSGEVIFPMADPIDPYAAGMVFMSNSNGESLRRLEVYQGSPDGDSPNFAKAGGLGDPQLFCEEAPIEIGNIVWWDNDLDGLMDPSEPGIPNVTIQLLLDPDGNTQGNNPTNNDEILVATTTTDAFGRYIFSFSGNNNGISAESWQNGHDRVLPNSFYQIRIADFVNDAGIIAIAGGGQIVQSPTQNQGMGGSQRDNNGYDNPGNAASAVATGSTGQNDHSHDFAFGPGCTPPALNPVATAPCVDGTISIQANISGGVPPYSFSWTGPNGFSSAEENPTIENASTDDAGDYTVMVMDAVGCPASFTLEVVVNELDATITPTDPTCGNSNGALQVTVNNGLEPYMYSWTNSLSGDNPTGLAAGNYTVTITDANGCTSVQTASLSNSDGPGLVINGTNETCTDANGSITLDITGGTPTSIDWNDNSLDGIEDPTGLSAGTYSVTVTVGGCPAVASITLTDTPSHTLMSSFTDETCGDANGTIDLTVMGGVPPYQFDWSDNSLDGMEDPTGLSAGTYNVTVTDATLCEQMTTIMIPNQVGPMLVATPTNETCTSANGAVDLMVNGGTPPYQFDWDVDGTGDNNDMEDLVGVGAGTYNVTVIDANGCTANTSAMVTDSPAPTISVSNVVDATTCNTSNGSIEIMVNGGAAPIDIDWDNDGLGEGGDMAMISSLDAGDYFVSVTDNNGCTASLSIVVGLSNGVDVNLAITDPQTCAEQGSADVTVTGGVPPYTYDWDHLPGTNDPEDIMNLDPGVYRVTVTDSEGCTNIGAANVSVKDIREPVLSALVTDPDCILNNDGAIDLSVVGGDGMGPYSYLWNTGATTQDLTGLAAGNYRVTVTDELMCASTLSFDLSADDAPLVSTSQENETCGDANGSIDLTVVGGTPGYSYSWSNSETTEDLTGLAAGEYTVTVMDATGCLAVTSVLITNTASPSLSATITPAGCAGGDGTIDLTVDGVGPFEFQWDNDGISDNDDVEDLTGLDAGTYNVTVTDINGCTETTQVEVTDDCTCDISIDNVMVTCQNGTDFSLTFDVSWDYMNATSEMIEVSIGGNAQTPFTPSGAMGMQSFGPINFTSPANGVLIEAQFSTNTSCLATSSIDLIACTDPCVDGLGGTTFQDFDNDGEEDPNDLGQGNILVEIYECDNPTPVATTYSNANGEWSIDDSGITYPVRVEFVIPETLSFLSPSAAGTNNGTNTQFLDASPDCDVDFGVIDPETYCQDWIPGVVPSYLFCNGLIPRTQGGSHGDVYWSKTPATTGVMTI